VDDRLLASERPTRGVCAGDVARVPATLGARVNQQQVADAQLALGWREVQNRRVVSAGDDRVKGEEVAAVAKERRLERDLKLALRPPRLDQLDKLRKTGARRPLCSAHPHELQLVLRTAHPNERVTQLDVRLQGCSQMPHRSISQPLLQLLNRPRPLGNPLPVPLKPAPEQLPSRHRLDEFDPSGVRIEGQNTTWTLTIGQVEILRVCPKRVCPVAAPRYGNLPPGGNQHDTRRKSPSGCHRLTPPFEEGRSVHSGDRTLCCPHRSRGRTGRHSTVIGGRSLLCAHRSSAGVAALALVRQAGPFDRCPPHAGQTVSLCGESQVENCRNGNLLRSRCATSAFAHSRSSQPRRATSC
jgi:hypothetical protein